VTCIGSSANRPSRANRVANPSAVCSIMNCAVILPGRVLLPLLPVYSPARAGGGGVMKPSNGDQRRPSPGSRRVPTTSTPFGVRTKEVCTRDHYAPSPCRSSLARPGVNSARALGYD
jgi:hypothetical protein